jgi:hypothetical protein
MQMSNGHRTMTLVLTEAQHDVLQAALDTAWVQWDNKNRIRDRQTLLRTSSRLNIAWAHAARG